MKPVDHVTPQAPRFLRFAGGPLAALSAVACACLLAACGSAPPTKLDPNTFPMPDAYHNAQAPGSTEAVADAPRKEWWTQYGSEELNRLVDRSLANNSELKIATLQVAQAKIRADQARGGAMPTLSAPVRAAVQNGSPSTDPTQNSLLALSGTFRLDVWGEQRALVDSADMQLERAVHERENTQRNTIGNLVATYIAYLSVSDSIRIARENEAVATEILHTVERRMALGDATADDLEQQRSTVFSLQAALPTLENQQEDFLNNLSKSVGALPGNLTLSDKGLDELQLPSIRAGLPSALLLGRPDIRMMESRMRAAHANIDVAHARLLPPIDLSSQAGYSGTAWATLLQPQNFLISTAATLAVSIFDGGVKKGEEDFAQSYYEEMVETYGQTVSQAVREVESALTSLKTSTRRLEAQKNATRSALNIFKIASDAFAAGSIDQTALLESRKNYQRGVDETQRVKAELLRNYATLSYALGQGSILKESSKVVGLDASQKPNPGMNLSVGTVQGAAVLLADAQVPAGARGSWEVELPGIFHRSSLLPLWRDLHTRYAAGTNGTSGNNGPWIHAVHVDHVNAKDQSGEAWYRVFVTGFQERQATASYCDTLLRSGQGCKVVADPQGGQKTAWLTMKD